MTFNRAKQRYATTHVDTVLVTKQVTLTIPRDSAVLRLTTDTTHAVSQARQGRATVRIVREPHYTTIYAHCDSASITKAVVAKIPQQQVSWGVNKWYKRGFYLFIGTTIALAIALLTKFFTISINRKT